MMMSGALARRGRAAAEHVHTVGGRLPAGRLGVTLVHEHVMVDFIGAGDASKDRYDAGEVFNVALPYLKRIRSLGCRSLVECTPAYLGRDALLLKRLADASGIRIITNTGYYGAVGGKYLPRHAFEESAEKLAGRWTEEFSSGIEGTGIRPGIIKIGVNQGPLSQTDAKLVRAAALTHKATGLTIASHTGNGPAALEQLDILVSAGVAPDAFIWVHAQNETNAGVHAAAGGRGAWLEFEGITEKTLAARVDQVVGLINKGLLRRILISLDAGWYHVGEPGGGTFRGYEFFFTSFIPALRKAGITDSQIRRLTTDNPREALILRTRLV
ncbi:MAG: phosphotriesterase [Acidobacteria bacterium]|nr:phosphotriesterase [Acidobacteriota bacterium]